ncbi:hypothetical protein FE257_000404 [Aspergillus nanangensis]|uniref:F-box domain-containing protein n=1 Tax=Aspergillus nanangensis TaxID=2582783 RepID=A0AAD4CU96_ASPNN|nr:hypothetical protein FE257_000404 [Aspergillus nanangensis]
MGFCPLCGVFLGLGGSPNSFRTWWDEGRAIVQDRTTHPPSCRLTGVGKYYRNRNDGDFLLAPSDSTISSQETTIKEKIPLFQKNESCMSVSFHESCWQLLRARIPHIPEDLVVASIVSQLDVVPCPESVSDDWRWSPEEPAILHPNPTNQAFAKLPLELTQKILSYLSLTQVLQVRLVCRDMAFISMPERLPLSFWKNQFAVGMEFGFLFPSFVGVRDWRRLFRGARSLWRTHSASIVGRQRICKLLEPIARVVELESKGSIPLCGLPLASSTGGDECPRKFRILGSENGLHDDFMEDVSFRGRMASFHGAQLSEGCSATQHRLASFPSCTPTHAYFRVTMVQIGVTTYISGIHYHHNQGLEDAPSHLGFFTGLAEKEVTVPASDEVDHFEVAFSSQGMTGIRVFFSSGAASPWAGQHEGPTIAVGMVRLPKGATTFYLAAGLDAYKIVALALVRPATTTSNGIWLSSESNPNARLIRSTLWKPSIPKHPNWEVSPSFLPWASQSQEPLINMDFGGPGGNLLGSLIGMTVHIKAGYNIVGITYEYSDRAVTFGCAAGVGLSFFIDGPGGERITVVKLICFKNQRAHGLEVSTNLSRSFTFCSQGLDTLSEKFIFQLQVPAGHILTGLVAVQEVSAKLGVLNEDSRQQEAFFPRIGIQSQPLHYPLPSAPADSHEVHIRELLQREAKNDMTFAQHIRISGLYGCRTYASLENVKRVRISIGPLTRIGELLPNNSFMRISGLGVEYYEHKPAFVGQWMEEHAAFDLEIDEKFRCITIWLSHNSNERHYGHGLGTGQVVAIRFDTTYGRQLHIQPRSLNALPLQDGLQYQYQAGIFGDLTALSWITTDTLDGVRVISTSERNVPLIPIPEPSHSPAQIQEILFNPVTQDGKVDSIMCICGFFASNVLREEREALVGLEFKYHSHKARAIGDTTTAGLKQQTIFLPQGSKITRIKITGRAKTIVTFEVWYSFGLSLLVGSH